MMQNNSLEPSHTDKALSPLDKIKAHLLHDIALDREQDMMLVRYRKAFTLMATKKSPSQAVKVIMKEYSLSYAQGCKAVRDAIKLFGDVNDYSRIGLKQLMFERFMRAAARAEDAEDFAAMEKLLHRACLVMDLYNPNNMDKNVNNIFQITINRSTDPAVLQKTNTIDVTPDE